MSPMTHTCWEQRPGCPTSVRGRENPSSTTCPARSSNDRMALASPTHAKPFWTATSTACCGVDLPHVLVWDGRCSVKFMQPDSAMPYAISCARFARDRQIETRMVCCSCSMTIEAIGRDGLTGWPMFNRRCVVLVLVRQCGFAHHCGTVSSPYVVRDTRSLAWLADCIAPRFPAQSWSAELTSPTAIQPAAGS